MTSYTKVTGHLDSYIAVTSYTKITGLVLK